MTYNFKDLMALGPEAIGNGTEYRDYTNINESDIPAELKGLAPDQPTAKLATWILEKGIGKDVRLALALAVQWMNVLASKAKQVAERTQTRQDNLEDQTARDVAQMEAEKDAVIANATVDSEVILARGGKATLQARLDDTTAQLAQNITRTESIFDIKTLGIVGDGSIDETEKLQEIVDYSRNENIKVINYDKNLVINISKPIYFDGGEDIDFGYANINKTTNTKGEGSNLSNNRIGSDGDYTVDEYNVDAHFIFRHEDHRYTSNLKTVNIHFGTTAPNKHDFAIFVPRVSYWEIENITATHIRFNKFIYSYSMWQIPKFNNIECFGGDYLLEIANDGANIGASTSINANQLYNLGGKGVLKVYSVAYSTFTNVFGHDNTDVPFMFTACRGVTVNSAEIEGIYNGKFAWIMGSHVTFNSPSALTLKGVPDTYTYLWNIEASKVVINAGRFPNYSEGTPQYNGGVFLHYGSHVTLNQCRMPSNMSSHRGLTDGSTITTIDENGVTVESLEGTGTMFNGRKIYEVAGRPTSGKWKSGDIGLFRTGGEGKSMGYICTRSGEFGVTEQNPKFVLLPNAQPGFRQQQFGTEPPKDEMWWLKGDMVINTNPSHNGVFAWVCVNEGFAPGGAEFHVLKLTTE